MFVWWWPVLTLPLISPPLALCPAVNRKGMPVRFFFQNFDQAAVETAIYELLHEEV